MTKFSDDIKKIVGVDRDKASDINLVDQGGIPSVRGIGTQSNGGATSSTATGGGDENSTTDSGDTTGKTDNTGSGDTGNSNSPNPNNQDSFIKDPNKGKFGAETLIDGTDGPSIKTSDLATFAGVGFEGGSLSGITATDCDTGDTLDIRIDGLLVPPPATTYSDGTPKTAEWVQADVQPTIDGYQSGFYWETDTPSSIESDAPFRLVLFNAAMLDNNRGAPFIGSGGPGTIYGPNTSGDYYEFTSYTAVTSTTYQATVTQTDVAGTPIGPAGSAWSVTRQACPGTDGIVSCPLETPVENFWPADNTISLTFNNGKFEGSSFDPEITTKYVGQDNSSVSFCMSGSRTGLIRAGREGGTVLYETDGSGAPIGVVRYYDSSGAFAGASDTTGYQMFLPPGDS